MQKITIEIPDDLFDAFDRSLKQMGKKFAETAANFVSATPYFSDINQTARDNIASLEEWKRERGFGINGKGLSRSLRGRNSPE